jgi:hypothetical protein
MPESPGAVGGAGVIAETALTTGSKGTIETIDSAVAGWTESSGARRAESAGVGPADQAAVAASAACGTPPANADADAGEGAGTVIK